ncbi:transposase IS111A/IS1328/IS1533 [Candidatus Protofrankia californiensis]|uniref:Transposase IS111A/IS1328/IS1533 n=1 Tax=Candidatus Protofrankia californiensis TaxID=1839754 RepID=A0A1C3NZI6_9ACTN|nr:transposase IS111A/IS1328/IS1533 [Candidatus Protofrankia californiensis]
MAAALGEHPDAKIFTSLPRSGRINATRMLTEWGDVRQAYDGPESVAALTGVTPVTKESGKHRAAHFRWACNKRFCKTLTTFADNSHHESPWAAHVYAHDRAHDRPHAVRILARAWVRVIWRCRADQIPYDPGRESATAVEQPRSSSTITIHDRTSPAATMKHATPPATEEANEPIPGATGEPDREDNGEDDGHVVIDSFRVQMSQWAHRGLVHKRPAPQPTPLYADHAGARHRPQDS